MDTAPDPSRANILLAARAGIEAQARRHGYVEPAEWQAAAARLAAAGCSQTQLAELRAKLSQSSAAEHWVFSDEPSPADQPRALERIVEKARSQSRRVRVITQDFLSALLRLAAHWGLEHDLVAQEIAARSVAEHWSVDWELACGMEGLLAAEQAAERRRTAREQAVVQFERRGRKGWLSAQDLSMLHTGMRERGIPETEARAFWDDLHASADARGWAWAGHWSGSQPREQRLNVLVDKVAAQAKARRRIARGFRQALLAETAAADVDEPTLRKAIAARLESEQWSATFDPRWLLAAEDRPWWLQLQRSCRRWLLDCLDKIDAVGRRRLFVQSALRVAPPTLALMVILSAFHTPAALPPLASPAPAAGDAALIPVTTGVPQTAPAPPPVVVHPITLVVAHTDGVGARLRTAPATGPVARLLREGTAVVEIGSELDVDGMGWKQVRAPDGTRGWMAADLLQPDDGAPGGMS